MTKSDSGAVPETKEPKFLQGSLMRHVSVMSLTSSIGLMSIFAVDLVDMIFISMLGNAALAAAVGYAGTLLFFSTSISIGFSIAAGALVAKALGARQEQQAREYATSVLCLGIVLSMLVMGLLLTNLDALLLMLGATGETGQLAARFLMIILPSMPILMAGMVASAVLRAHGDAKRAMWATLSAGIVNAVIDPILIFGLNLGLDGAAIASVLARLTVFGVAFGYAVKRYDGFATPNVVILKRDFITALGLAVPAVLTNVATPIGAAIVLREMARYGTDAVAAMAIIGRLTPVAFAVILALSGAVGPIIGQNFGAAEHSRVRGAFVAAIKFTFFYVLVAALLLYFLRDPIATGFGAEDEARALIYLFCGPLALCYFFNGVMYVGNAAFNNLGHPFYSTLINWGRNTLGTWPFVMAGAHLWGASGVLIGQAAGGVLFAGISWWLGVRLLCNEALASPRDVEAFQAQKRDHVLHNRTH